ncbi:MAG: L,D-transpeptidase family protein [Rhodospirillales bacterium]|nr:L,D-transpeptidase family protein [Rhodospirillales bacterium]
MRLSVTQDGKLIAPGLGSFRCALGRTGILMAKKEGDGATPAGIFPLRRVFFRPDRQPFPVTRLPVWPLHSFDGWCDAPDHPDYNRPVRLPFAASHEKMWRDDSLYDLGAVLGHNDDPPLPGLGSAIFMHVAKPDYAPTEGCVALSLADLAALLGRVEPGDEIEIQAG